MTFEIKASSYQIERERLPVEKEAVRAGLIGGGVAVYLCLIGLVDLMADRWVVTGLLPVGHLFLAIVAFAAAYLPARDADSWGSASVIGAIGGLITGIFLALLAVFLINVDIRATVVTAGPPLLKVLSFGRAPLDALWLLPLSGILIGALAGSATRLAHLGLSAPLVAALTVVMAAFTKDIWISFLGNAFDARRFAAGLFGMTGLRPLPAGILFTAALAFILGLRWYRNQTQLHFLSARHTRWLGYGSLLAVALLAPVMTNAFVAQVLILVCLYALMAMGLNIELGYAGLVDLGFVAFYAIGAYTVALLSGTGALSVANLPFWLVLPLAIIFAALGGILFGMPVLRVRGDYLAMATLGLGEIVRVLVLSEAAKPALGGSMGIDSVSRPEIGSFVLNTPTSLYYVAFALLGLVALATVRLKDSKIGRAWMALKEDEDVAQALGIDPVLYKLIAYTTGAAFAGAAGAVFAVLVGGVYPHSFMLLVSTNVLAILIIGGFGSIPGVILGSLVLVGIPELLREFGEYRYLMYGAVLVAMMHLKPGGLWPVRKG